MNGYIVSDYILSMLNRHVVISVVVHSIKKNSDYVWCNSCSFCTKKRVEILFTRGQDSYLPFIVQMVNGFAKLVIEPWFKAIWAPNKRTSVLASSTFLFILKAKPFSFSIYALIDNRIYRLLRLPISIRVSTYSKEHRGFRDSIHVAFCVFVWLVVRFNIIIWLV